jgi:hypothetical protein
VQLRLPWFSNATPPAPPTPPAREVVVLGRTFPILVARHRRARRYVLRLTTDGALRLTVPRSLSIAGGVRFAERQADWIAREWRRQQQSAEPWTSGTTMWMRGVQVALDVQADRILCGVESVPSSGGADVRAAVEGHLRALATTELVGRCLELARSCGVDVARVAVRNQRSRWGACSVRGVITLNWRLIQMPPSVSDYVIFHELMHRRHTIHALLEVDVTGARQSIREVEFLIAAFPLHAAIGLSHKEPGTHGARPAWVHHQGDLPGLREKSFVGIQIGRLQGDVTASVRQVPAHYQQAFQSHVFLIALQLSS